MSLFFIAEGRQLQIPIEVLNKSHYFSKLLKNQKYSEARITVPEWMSYRHLEGYFTYLRNDNLGKFDVQALQKILWIGDYFQDQIFQEKAISEILPSINRDSALVFLQDSAVKIASGSFIEPWKLLFNQAKSILSQNLRYVLSNYPDAFDKLENSVAEEVIEHTLSCKFLNGIDHSVFIERLKVLRGVQNISRLLYLEEKKIQETKLPCVFRWENKIVNYENDLAESEVFVIDKMRWQMIYHFKQNNLTLSLKFKEENVRENTMIAVCVLTVIRSENGKSPVPKLILLPVASLSSAVIYENLIVDYDLIIDLYAKVQYVYSAIIQDLIIHPQALLNEDISELSFDCLEFLISLKNLNTKDEDSVFEILCKWVESTASKPNEQDLKELLDCIRWDFISIKSLMTSVSKYPSLKSYFTYHEVFKKELDLKIHSSQTRHKPRYGYRNKSLKEVFLSQKDYLETIADILLDFEFYETKPTKENDEVINELNLSINKQEAEISKLKNKYSVLRASQDFNSSPTPCPEKFMESSESFHRVPNRLRNSSMSVTIGTGNKSKARSNKTGKLLSSLLRKLTPKS